MKIITINLSEPHVKALQVLQDLGLYPSRSEAIRVAIRDFLQRELGFANIKGQDPPSSVSAPVDPALQAAERKKEIMRLLQKLRAEAPNITVMP